ncbi:MULTISPECIES: glycosyltransferase [unclassified Janthinobacterium]|uniref:glycosyltransferase n=1 Tax=unclassified Janthinobacterium TaxID=2610881 RepID=UPI00034BA13B|nr:MULTISPECIES: glycosyltransferase [unclassified Janthinobacterium]MEC5159791.1 glycosyltransferase involved in cell wall biosynthesis [Janthinobacterium sp. CG_S6]
MRSLFFVCNALDDQTRIERGITTDSPAASRKVLLMLKAARRAGVRAYAVSLGRGRQDGSGRYFGAKVARVDGVAVIYLPFLHTRLLSELLSLLAGVPLLWRLRRRPGRKTALCYNRLPAYLPTLLGARLLGFNTALDLEDGETDLRQWSLSGCKSRVLRWAIDSLCPGGALLACEALADSTRLRPTRCCYGTTEIAPDAEKWTLPALTALFGGTVADDTGAQLLIDAVERLRREAPAWAAALRIEVTGKGDRLEQLRALGQDPRHPAVLVHGRTSDAEYRAVLARTQVGLALKPNGGKLAHTTFPSKVIEFASHGMLVLTTDISDVKKVLGDGAVYLESDDAGLLIEKLRWIVANRGAAGALAQRGAEAVSAVCAPAKVGAMLDAFLFPAGPGGKR